MSSNVLNQMKIMLGGLGQVRVAEINLLDRASARQHITLPANRAVLDMGIRMTGQANKLSEITNHYANGIRWDEKTGEAYQANEKPTNAGLDKVIKTYLTSHPLYTKEEIADYDKRFNDDDAEKAKTKKKGKPAPEVPMLNTPPPSMQSAPPPPPGFVPKQ
jgi:hypothetical protein